MKLSPDEIAIYPEQIPGSFCTLGICAPESPEMPPLHSPQMTPDERAIPIGIEMLVGCCFDFFKRE